MPVLAIVGVGTFYLMGNPINGVAAESTQGITLANVAKKANIGEFVASLIERREDINLMFEWFDNAGYVEIESVS